MKGGVPSSTFSFMRSPLHSPQLSVPATGLAAVYDVAVQVDFAIELGRDDEVLDFRWSAPGQGLYYHDLKHNPGLLAKITEAERVPELGPFLIAINSSPSILQSVKCDVWTSSELSPEDEIFGFSWKFSSYVDLLFASPERRLSLADHERVAQRITELLKRVPDIPVAAEFLVRRCYDHSAGPAVAGFYITFYLFGYGADEMAARRQWAIGLQLVESAVKQMRNADS